MNEKGMEDKVSQSTGANAAGLFVFTLSSTIINIKLIGRVFELNCTIHLNKQLPFFMLCTNIQDVHTRRTGLTHCMAALISLMELNCKVKTITGNYRL